MSGENGLISQRDGFLGPVPFGKGIFVVHLPPFITSLATLFLVVCDSIGTTIGGKDAITTIRMSISVSRGSLIVGNIIRATVRGEDAIAVMDVPISGSRCSLIVGNIIRATIRGEDAITIVGAGVFVMMATPMSGCVLWGSGGDQGECRQATQRGKDSDFPFHHVSPFASKQTFSKE
jgi:hypothetical protein